MSETITTKKVNTTSKPNEVKAAEYLTELFPKLQLRYELDSEDNLSYWQEHGQFIFAIKMKKNQGKRIYNKLKKGEAISFLTLHLAYVLVKNEVEQIFFKEFKMNSVEAQKFILSFWIKNYGLIEVVKEIHTFYNLNSRN